MKIVDKKENQATFIADIDETLANAIRRYLNHIPIIAVDEVEISRNDSPLYDETVAHRLGLIPLKQSGARKTGTLSLDAKKEGFVHSGDISGDAKVVYDKIPITYLNKDQEVSMKATLTTGKGIEHSKFSPGLMFYRNMAEITVDKETYEGAKEILADNEIKEKGNKVTVIDDKKKEAADILESVAYKKGKKAEVEIKDGLIVSLESFGQMDVIGIFEKSVEELKKDLSEVSKAIK